MPTAMAVGFADAGSVAGLGTVWQMRVDAPPGERDRPSFEVLVHGQMVYVDPQARVVGVKLSSWPVPQDPAMLSAALRAFDACAAYLTPRGAG